MILAEWNNPHNDPRPQASSCGRGRQTLRPSISHARRVADCRSIYIVEVPHPHDIEFELCFRVYPGTLHFRFYLLDHHVSSLFDPTRDSPLPLFGSLPAQLSAPTPPADVLRRPGAIGHGVGNNSPVLTRIHSEIARYLSGQRPQALESEAHQNWTWLPHASDCAPTGGSLGLELIFTCCYHWVLWLSQPQVLWHFVASLRYWL
jgi:hypothetical protein